MLFFSGCGLAGVAASRGATHLPAGLRANSAGVSGGALGALATALGDYEAILRAIDTSFWPGDPECLSEALDDSCTLGLTFATWPLRGGESVPLCVVAFDCTRMRPVLFSSSTTPNVSVARAVSAAASWPGAAPSPAMIEGFPYCDVEFFVSFMDIFAQLSPSRAVAIRGTTPTLVSLPGRIADHHTAFMAALRRPCVGFVAHVPGPHILDAMLRRGSATSLLREHGSSSYPGLWLLIACVVSFLLTPFLGKVNIPPRSRAPAEGASNRKERCRIGQMRQAAVGEGTVEICKRK